MKQYETMTREDIVSLVETANEINCEKCVLFNRCENSSGDHTCLDILCGYLNEEVEIGSLLQAAR